MSKRESKRVRVSAGAHLASALGRNMDLLARFLPADQFERIKNAAAAASGANGGGNGSVSIREDASRSGSTNPNTPTGGHPVPTFDPKALAAASKSAYSKINVEGPLTSARLKAHNRQPSTNDLGVAPLSVAALQEWQPNPLPNCKANATEPPLGAAAMVSPMLRSRLDNDAFPQPPPFNLSSNPPRPSVESFSESSPASPVDVVATPTPGGVECFPAVQCPFGNTVVFDGSRRGSTSSQQLLQQRRVSLGVESATMRPTVGFVDGMSHRSSRMGSMSREPSPIADGNDGSDILYGGTVVFHERGASFGNRRSGTHAPGYTVFGYSETSSPSEHAFRPPSPLDVEKIRGTCAPIIQPPTAAPIPPTPFLSLNDTQQLVSSVVEVRGCLAPPVRVHWVDGALSIAEPSSPNHNSGMVIPASADDLVNWSPPKLEFPSNERLKAAEGGQLFKRLEKALADCDVETARGIFLRFPEADILEGYNAALDNGISSLYDGTRTQRVGEEVRPPWHTSGLSEEIAPHTPSKKMKEVLPTEMDVFSGKGERGTAVWLIEAINGRKDELVGLLLWQFERSLPQPADLLPPLPPLPHPSSISSSASAANDRAVDPFSSFGRTELTSPIHLSAKASVAVPCVDVAEFQRILCYNRKRRKQLSGILHAARVYGLANFKISEKALALTAQYVTVCPLMRLPGDYLSNEEIGLSQHNGRSAVGDTPATSSPASADRIVDNTLRFIAEYADYEKGLFGCCYGFDEDGEEVFLDVADDLQLMDDAATDPANSVLLGILNLNSTINTMSAPGSPRLNDSITGAYSALQSPRGGTVTYDDFPGYSSPLPNRSRSPSIAPGGISGPGVVDYPATLLAFAMHYLGLTPRNEAADNSTPSSEPSAQTFAISSQMLISVLEAVDANTLALVELERSALEKESSPLRASSAASSRLGFSAKEDKALKHPHDIWFPGLTSPCFWDRFPDTASLDFYLGQRLEVFLTLLRLQQIWYEQEAFAQVSSNADKQWHVDPHLGDSGFDNGSSSVTPCNLGESPVRARSISLMGGGSTRRLSLMAASPVGSMRRLSVIGTPSALSPMAQALNPSGGGQLHRSESMQSVQSTSTVVNASFTSYSATAPMPTFSRKPQLSALSTGTMDQHAKALKLEEAIEKIKSRKKDKKGKKTAAKLVAEEQPPLHPDEVQWVTHRIASSAALEGSRKNRSFHFSPRRESGGEHRASPLFCNTVGNAVIASCPPTPSPSPMASSNTFGSAALVPVTPAASLVAVSAAFIDAVERRHYANVILKDDIQTLRSRLSVTWKDETEIVGQGQPVLKAPPPRKDGEDSDVSLPASFEMEVMNIRSAEYARQYVPPMI